MRGMPKIVLERLKRKPLADQQDRQSAIDNRQPLHPDANLLAAFVEKTLAGRERTQVLNHLAQCAECRELASLTSPAEAVVAEPTRLRSRRGWSIWPALRWGALAAALGAVAIIVVVHSYPRKRQTIAPRPASAEPKQQVSLMAAASPPVAMETKSIRTLSRGREMSKRERSSSVGATPSPPPLAKPAFETPAASGGTSNVTAGAVSRGGAATLSASAEARPVSKDLRATQVVEDLAPSSALSLHHLPLPFSERGGGKGGAATASVRAESQQARLSSMAFRGELAPTPAQPAALWTISPDGKLQRSDDGGSTWKDVPVDDKVTFRVIRAVGRDVWAGGSGGALYRSSNDGAIWTRVNLSSAGSSTTETILSITVSPPDLQHITVTTVAGQQWTTEDSGQHWQKEAR
ncbi:MAG TPA: YCF48-related protein [Terriglobia bacterium]|nr:YCF48-related protein [Terriglobia bacterium]